MQQLILDGQFCDLNSFISANNRNRYISSKIKKEETERVKYACLDSDLETITECSDFIFCWYVPNKRKDPDNVAFAVKFILDGMVSSGVLPTDSMKFVSGLSHVFKVDKENPRVKISIVPSGISF